MPKTTNWREIRARRPPNEAAVELEKLKLRLAILREQVGASQVEMAEALGVSQPAVSQIERSEDPLLSTIAKYVHGLGGELQVNAVFGDTTYKLIEMHEPIPKAAKVATGGSSAKHRERAVKATSVAVVKTKPKAIAKRPKG